MRVLSRIFGSLAMAVMLVLAAAAIVGISLATMAYAAHLATDQARTIGPARPVTAQIVSSKLRTYVEYGNSKHAPEIRFRYTVDGRPYESGRVAPTPITQTADAEAVVAANPPGATRQAWYDPADPGRSFLIRRFVHEAYAMWYAGLAYSLIAAQVVPAFVAFRTFAKPRPRPDGWVRLPVERPLRTRIAVELARAAWFAGAAALAAWHQFAHTEDPPRGQVYAALAGFALVALWFVYRAARVWRVRRWATDARVTIDPDSFRPGRTARLRVEQDLRRPTTVRQIKVGLTCTGAFCVEGDLVQQVWERWETRDNPEPKRAIPEHPLGSIAREALAAARARGDHPPAPAGTLTVDAAFGLSDAVVPTTQGTVNERYRYALIVVTTPDAGPPYRAEFDVTVQEI